MKPTYILLNSFQQSKEEYAENQKKISEYKYYCWLPDGYANGDNNIAFDNIADIESHFVKGIINYIKFYMKEVRK